MDLLCMEIEEKIRLKLGDKYDKAMKEHPKLFDYEVSRLREPSSPDAKREYAINKSMLDNIYSNYAVIQRNFLPQIAVYFTSKTADLYIDDRIIREDREYEDMTHISLSDKVSCQELKDMLENRIRSWYELRYLNIAIVTKDRSNKARARGRVFAEMAAGLFAQTESAEFEEMFRIWLDKSRIFYRNNRHHICFSFNGDEVGLYSEKGRFLVRRIDEDEELYEPPTDENDPFSNVNITTDVFCRGIMSTDYSQEIGCVIELR